MYCRAYKQAAVASAHALLRKAKRLDQILNVRNDSSSSLSVPSDLLSLNLKCHKCTTMYTPAFYPSTESPSERMCHQCHYKKPIVVDGAMDIVEDGPLNESELVPMEVSVAA